ARLCADRGGKRRESNAHSGIECAARSDDYRRWPARPQRPATCRNRPWTSAAAEGAVRHWLRRTRHQPRRLPGARNEHGDQTLFTGGACGYDSRDDRIVTTVSAPGSEPGFTLNELELDALGELVNIGVSRAASSLGTMVGEQVLLSVPSVVLVSRARAA